MSKLSIIVVCVSALAACKKGGTSACPDVAADRAQKAGIVLPGAHVCKDDGLVATLEFPDAKPGQVLSLYSQKLVADGYTEQKLDDHISMFTRGDSEAVFATAADASQERNVPFAVVRYCSSRACVTDTQRLADAFKKAKTDVEGKK